MAGKKQIIWVHGSEGQIQNPQDSLLTPAGQGAVIKDTAKHAVHHPIVAGHKWPTSPDPAYNCVHYAIPTPSGRMYTLGKKAFGKATKATGSKAVLEAVLVRFKCRVESGDFGETLYASALTAVHVWDGEFRIHPFYGLNTITNNAGDVIDDIGLQENDWTTEWFRLPEKTAINYGLGVSLEIRFNVVGAGIDPLFFVSSVAGQFASVP